MVALPLMSFSRSKTTKAYPRWGFFFLFGFSLAWVSVTIRICNDSISIGYKQYGMVFMITYTLNRAESTKLLLQIMLIGIIAESCDDQGLEGVATDIGIFGRFI